MKTETKENALWSIIRTGEHGQPGQSHFIRVGDDHTLATLRGQYAGQGLNVSTCLYSAGDVKADRIYRLYFWICGKDLAETRVSVLETAYYVGEHFGIPDDQIEFLYDGEASIALIVPPTVFGGRPTPLMPALNRRLACQMVDDGIGNIDVDVYQRDYFIALPN